MSPGRDTWLAMLDIVGLYCLYLVIQILLEEWHQYQTIHEGLHKIQLLWSASHMKHIYNCMLLVVALFSE